MLLSVKVLSHPCHGNPYVLKWRQLDFKWCWTLSGPQGNLQTTETTSVSTYEADNTDLSPNSLHLGSTVKGHRAEQILLKAQNQLHSGRIRQIHFTIDVSKDRINQTHQKSWNSWRRPSLPTGKGSPIQKDLILPYHHNSYLQWTLLQPQNQP